MRVGVVGTGYLGRLHARVLTEMPEAKVVGFVERNDEAAAEIEKTAALTQGGTRLMWWPKVAAPEGWHFDKGASQNTAVGNYNFLTWR